MITYIIYQYYCTDVYFIKSILYEVYGYYKNMIINIIRLKIIYDDDEDDDDNDDDDDDNNDDNDDDDDDDDDEYIVKH